MFNALTETFNGPSDKTVRRRNDEKMKEYGIKDNLVGFTFKDDKNFRKYIINCKLKWRMIQLGEIVEILR